MSDLISRSALMEIIRQHDYPLATRQGSVDNGMFTTGIQQAVDECPAVDAVTVVHGRWKKNWHDNSLIGHEYEECSICGCMISDTEKFWDCNYCPNCGAKMDGERKDTTD